MDIKKLLPIIGVGAATGGAGFAAGSIGKKKNAMEIANMFDEYNREENKLIANNAFKQGVGYAMEKDSFYNSCVKEAFEDEMSKVAKPLKIKNPSILPSSVKKTINELLLRGKKANTPSLSESLKKSIKPLAIGAGAGVGATATAIALKNSMKKESSLVEGLAKVAVAKVPGLTMEKALKVAKKFILKNKKPLAIGAGAGAVGTVVADNVLD